MARWQGKVEKNKKVLKKWKVLNTRNGLPSTLRKVVFRTVSDGCAIHGTITNHSGLNIWPVLQWNDRRQAPSHKVPIIVHKVLNSVNAEGSQKMLNYNVSEKPPFQIKIKKSLKRVPVQKVFQLNGVGSLLYTKHMWSVKYQIMRTYRWK